MTDRPACYPAPADGLLSDDGLGTLPLLDVLTSPVPQGIFQSPLDRRHVLCLHLGAPVPVSYRAERVEREGVRLHGQFCVVPAGTSTRWTLSRPARSLLLRLRPSLLGEVGETLGLGSSVALAPAIHLRDPQIERIGWMMQLEAQEGHPGGRLFADSLASALAARLLAQQSRLEPTSGSARQLPAWRMRQVVAYIEAHLDEDLGLGELAAVAGFSLSHFKQLFRAAAGMPVHRFVLERRLERARTLLLEGRKSVTEVALETGFAHPSHLARSLRRALGLSPSELRAQAR